MAKVFRFIPNLITSANLLCGCLACVFAGLNQFEAAFWTVLLGITFDLFDGMIARMLNVTSDLGLQLDSLADVITSGFTPGIVVYQLFIRSGVLVNDYKINFFSETIVFSIAPLALMAFLLPIGAAFRLAKFNLIEQKSSDFFGLAIGGSLGSSKDEMHKVVEYTASKLKTNQEKYIKQNDRLISSDQFKEDVREIN